MELVGWLVVIVLIGFIIVYIVFEMLGRALEFAESNPLTIAVIILIVLVIALLSLSQRGPATSTHGEAGPGVVCV
jgi:hypothetical protein